MDLSEKRNYSIVSKIMRIELTPENIEDINFNHRAAELTFDTNLKGPAGSDVKVIMPYSAIAEANAAMLSIVARQNSFPAVRVINGRSDA